MKVGGLAYIHERECSITKGVYIPMLGADEGLGINVTSNAPLVDLPRFGQTCSNISESINSVWMVSESVKKLIILFGLRSSHRRLVPYRFSIHFIIYGHI